MFLVGCAVMVYSVTLTFERRTVGSRPLAIRRISDIQSQPKTFREKKGQLQVQIKNSEYKFETYIISRRDRANARNAILQVLNDPNIRIPLTDIIASTNHKSACHNLKRTQRKLTCQRHPQY